MHICRFQSERVRLPTLVTVRPNANLMKLMVLESQGDGIETQGGRGSKETRYRKRSAIGNPYRAWSDFLLPVVGRQSQNDLATNPQHALQQAQSAPGAAV